MDHMRKACSHVHGPLAFIDDFEIHQLRARNADTHGIVLLLGKLYIVWPPRKAAYPDAEFQTAEMLGRGVTGNA